MRKSILHRAKWLQTAVRCLLLISLFSKVSLAQDSFGKFIRLPNNRNLPLRATAICQDKNGLMWIGSMAGLFQYDGYKLTAFKNIIGDSTSISNNYINSIFRDRSGDLWVGTWGGGLNKYVYETNSFKRFQNKSNCIGDVVSSIFEDKSRRLWVGTYDSGLYMLDANRKSVVKFKTSSKSLNSISSDQIGVITEDDKGNLIIGTRNGLNIFDPITKCFTRYFHQPNNPNSISNDIVGYLCFDRQHRIWVSTSGGCKIFRVSGKQLVNITDSLSLPIKFSQLQFGFVREDGVGNIWISSVDGLSGLFRYNSKVKKLDNFLFNQDDIYSISDNTLNAFYEDRNGVIWFGTNNNGCFLFDYKLQNEETVVSKANNPTGDLLSYNFYRLFEDSKGRIWCTNNTDGLIGIDTQSRKIRKVSSLIATTSNPSIISEIKESADGSLWVSTINGFYNFRANDCRIKHYKKNPNNPNSLNSDLSLSILEDKSGVLWIGTNGSGLNRFDPKTNIYSFYTYDPKGVNSLSSNSIYTIYEDSQGKFFIGTSEGLDELDRSTGKITNLIGKSDSLQSIIVLSIIESKNDRGKIYWICTSQGLFKLNYETKALKYYSEKSGMKNSFLSGMVDDDKGNLWISTFDGLIRFDVKTEKFESFDITKGLPKDEYNVKSIIRGRNGKIYLGGVNGLYSFFPDSLCKPTKYPSVLVNDFQIFNKPVPIGKVINKRVILKKSITESKEIELSYLENIFSLDFSAIDYRFSDMVYYAYILEGFEKDWNYIGNRHFVTYTQLPHGEYTFKVKASFNSETWGEPCTSLKIVIRPPWWKTTLFYIALPIVALLLLYFFIKIRERNLRLEKIRLEKTILERTKDLSEANTQLEEHQAELEIKQEEITAQAELLASTNKELEKLSIVASKTDNAVIIMDAEANFEWVNEGFVRMFCNLDTLIEKGTNLITTSPKENISEIVNECLTSKKSVHYQTYNAYNSDQPFWTQTTLTPIVSSSGEILKLIAIDSDITKLKEAEFEIVKQKNELEVHRNHLEEIVKQRTNELEIAKDKAEEGDRLKSAFLANMSHEIRTPMNAIIGFSNLLSNDDLSSKERNDFIRYIINNSNTLLHLIDDIIDLSKIEAGQLRISIKPFDLNRLLLDLYHNFSNRSNSYSNSAVDLKFSMGITTSDFTIQADAIRVKQVLSNLIDNALKFTEKGVVEFGYTVENSTTIKFFVKDSGIGMSESQQKLIFNRFTKVEEDKTKLYRGAGLGLTICKNIANLMGGDVLVESEIGKGTVFYFTIPLIKGVERAAETYFPESNKTNYIWEGKLLLIAEDEEDNYRYLERVLKNTKAKLFWAANGSEVIELFKKINPDLILMDIKMPIKDGVEATKEIRQENKMVPIIALSAYAFNHEIEEITKEGFNGYLVKPTSPAKLLSSISEFLK